MFHSVHTERVLRIHESGRLGRLCLAEMHSSLCTGPGPAKVGPGLLGAAQWKPQLVCDARSQSLDPFHTFSRHTAQAAMATTDTWKQQRYRENRRRPLYHPIICMQC